MNKQKTLLTEKCKEHFEKWYPDYIKQEREDYIKYPDIIILKKFYREILAMQYGVFQDFFSNSGFPILVMPLGDDSWTSLTGNQTLDNQSLSLARRSSIEEANKNYNTAQKLL